MGDQFWWFYDVLAAAIILVSMFIAGRQGAVKAMTNFVAYLLAGVIALSLSGSLGAALAGSAMKESNSKKINDSLSSMKFNVKVAEYIQTLDYGVKADPVQIAKIYAGKKDYNTEIYKYLNNRKGRNIGDDQETFNTKLTEGYAQIIKAVVAEDMNKYASEVAAKEVREHPLKFNELIPLLMDKETKSPAADFISRNYVQPAYDTIIKLICFIVVFVLLLLLMLFFAKTLIGDSYQELHLPQQIGGSFIGIMKAAVLILALAVVVRLSVVLGSNEMLFFNHKAINKTYIFKYLYKYVSNNI